MISGDTWEHFFFTVKLIIMSNKKYNSFQNTSLIEVLRYSEKYNTDQWPATGQWENYFKIGKLLYMVKVTKI